MSDSVRRFLSHECGPLAQFVKYGLVGGFATLVQFAGFYVLATTVLPCLKSDDVAVRYAGFAATEASDVVRGCRFALATALAFLLANVVCWLLNRAIVFRAGKYPWYKEFGFFLAVSGLAMAVATGLCGILISSFGMMTSLASVIEVVISFVFNYFLRKFVIFKG